jgi:hypothetical protein
MKGRSFTSAGGTSLKAGLLATIAVGALAAVGLVTSPLALAALWCGTIAFAIPLRWNRVTLSPEGLTLEQGLDFFTRRGRYVHDGQILEIKQILTDQVSLLLIVTTAGPIRIETADLPRRALIAALEERYGPIETLHTFYAPFGPLKR